MVVLCFLRENQRNGEGLETCAKVRVEIWARRNMEFKEGACSVVEKPKRYATGLVSVKAVHKDEQ